MKAILPTIPALLLLAGPAPAAPVALRTLAELREDGRLQWSGIATSHGVVVTQGTAYPTVCAISTRGKPPAARPTAKSPPSITNPSPRRTRAANADSPPTPSISTTSATSRASTKTSAVCSMRSTNY